MKKIAFTLTVLLLTLSCLAQNKGPITFMGIPIDGTQAQFEAKLLKKGFTYNSSEQNYCGQFDGDNVKVFVHVNHDNVYGVSVVYPFTSQETCRWRFNTLSFRFGQLDKYRHFDKWNKKVDNEAVFLYYSSERDYEDAVYQRIGKLFEFYSEDEISLFYKYVKLYITSTDAQIDSLKEQLEQEIELRCVKNNLISYNYHELLFVSIADGIVDLSIRYYLGQYYVLIEYLNVLNSPRGEDL